MILSTQPAPVQAEEATIYLTGLFMYREEQAGNASALAFFREFLRGAADFEQCTGSYRMRIVCPDGREVYFGDNAGIMRWYIGPKGFFTTLREAAPDNSTPNEAAIAQFLHYGCIFGPETVLREVRRTDPGKYYLLEKGNVREKGKGLPPPGGLRRAGRRPCRADAPPLPICLRSRGYCLHHYWWYGQPGNFIPYDLLWSASASGYYR